MWVKIIISQIVIFFFNIQFIEFFKRIFENLDLKKKHIGGSTMDEINTILIGRFNNKHVNTLFAFCLKKTKSKLMGLSTEILQQFFLLQ